MLFLGIITILNLQAIITIGDRHLLESAYLNKYPIPTEPKSGGSPLDL